MVFIQDSFYYQSILQQSKNSNNLLVQVQMYIAGGIEQKNRVSMFSFRIFAVQGSPLLWKSIFFSIDDGRAFFDQNLLDQKKT